jgi:hypothetical protein
MLVYELNGSNSRRAQSKPNLFSCNFQESGINNFQIKFLYNFVILEFFIQNIWNINSLMDENYNFLNNKTKNDCKVILQE